ncbi:hypothetical protein pb186bvf_009442 [Paramecium bursaria]
MITQEFDMYEAQQQVWFNQTKMSIINSQIIDKADEKDLQNQINKEQVIQEEEDQLLSLIQQCLESWNTNIKFVVQNEEQISSMYLEIETFQQKIMLGKYQIKGHQQQQESVELQKKSTTIQQSIKEQARKSQDNLQITQKIVKLDQEQIMKSRQQVQQLKIIMANQYYESTLKDLVKDIPQSYDKKDDPLHVIKQIDNIQLECQEWAKLAHQWFEKEEAIDIFEDQSKELEMNKQLIKQQKEESQKLLKNYENQLQELSGKENVINQKFNENQLLFQKELDKYLKQETQTIRYKQELELVDPQLYYYEFLKQAFTYSEQIKQNQLYQNSVQQQLIQEKIQYYQNKILKLSLTLGDTNKKLESSSTLTLSTINHHYNDYWSQFNYQSMFEEVCQLIRNNQPKFNQQIQELYLQLEQQYSIIKQKQDQFQEFQNEISLQKQFQRYLTTDQQKNNQKIKKMLSKIDILKQLQYNLNNKALTDEQQKLVLGHQLGQATAFQLQTINGVQNLTTLSKRQSYQFSDVQIYENLTKIRKEQFQLQQKINEANIHKQILILTLEHLDKLANENQEPLNDAQVQSSPQKTNQLIQQEMKELEKQIQSVRRNISKVKDFLIGQIETSKNKELIRYVQFVKEKLQFDFQDLLNNIKKNQNIMKISQQIKSAITKRLESQQVLWYETFNTNKFQKFSEQSFTIFAQQLVSKVQLHADNITKIQNQIQEEQKRIDMMKQKIQQQSQSRSVILGVFHQIYAQLDQCCSQKIKQLQQEFELAHVELLQIYQKQQQIKQKRQQMKQKQQETKTDFHESKLEQSRVKCQLALQQNQGQNINIEEQVFLTVTSQIFERYGKL